MHLYINLIHSFIHHYTMPSPARVPPRYQWSIYNFLPIYHRLHTPPTILFNHDDKSHWIPYGHAYAWALALVFFLMGSLHVRSVNVMNIQRNWVGLISHSI